MHRKTLCRGLNQPGSNAVTRTVGCTEQKRPKVEIELFGWSVLANCCSPEFSLLHHRNHGDNTRLWNFSTPEVEVGESGVQSPSQSQPVHGQSGLWDIPSQISTKDFSVENLVFAKPLNRPNSYSTVTGCPPSSRSKIPSFSSTIWVRDATVFTSHRVL